MKLNVLNEYVLAKHNILPGTQVTNIAEVANNHLGLHSARIMTPYTTLCSRLVEYTPQMLTSQLFETRELIKLRCMRKTLHMVPHNIAGLLHMATLKLRIAECVLFFDRNNISIDRVERFRETIKDYLNIPQKSSDIESFISQTLAMNEANKHDYAKLILKYVWEVGDLCYVNVANNWEKEDRRYASTKKYYPNLVLNELTSKEAQELLVYYYIKRFGPATIKDFSWWSGLSAKLMADYIEKNNSTFSSVYFDNCDKEFFVLNEELDNLEGYRCIEYDWVTLLAYEDPSIKGYYESRFRYVDEDKYTML